MGTSDASLPHLRLYIFRMLVLLVCRCAASAPGEIESDYLIQRWETEHGLPENSATAFAQTEDGFLWFGTYNGLVRFDGVEFKVFGPAEIPAMKSAGVVNLFLDARQRLWVSTYDGLVLRESDAWRRLGAEEGWTGDHARSFAGRADGEVLITDFKGRIFESAGNGVRELPPPDAAEKGQGFLAGVDDEGLWWVVQWKFIGRREGDRWVEKIPPGTSGRSSVACGPARGGGLWVLTGRELRRLQQGKETERRQLPEAAGGVWSLTEDSRGHVWVASYNLGFSRIGLDGGMTRWNGANGGYENGRGVFEDREGSLWFGSSGDGLARFSARRFHVHKYGPGVSGGQIASVAPRAGGGLWLASRGFGLAELKPDGTTAKVAIPDSDRRLAYLLSVLEDRSGAVWIGADGFGLHRWADGRLETFPAGETGGPAPRVIFEDSKGRLWTGGGEFLAVREQGAWRQAGPALKLEVVSVAEDTGGGIWVAHSGGVFRIETGDHIVPVEDAGAPLTGITALLAGDAGTMWLGSASRGLLRWKSGALAPVPGFPVNRVDALVADAGGNLWATSVHRLVRAPQEELQAAAVGRPGPLAAQVFDSRDGLAVKQFSATKQPVAVRDAEGRLWFAAMSGVASFEPGPLRLNASPPPVHLLRLHYHVGGAGPDDEASVHEIDGPFPSPVNLPPDSRYLEIHFAGLSLTAPEKNRYQVRLGAGNEPWQDTGGRRMASFHQVPPGEYDFQVRAANNDGVWNEQAATLRIRILPHYWQTKWFRLLMVTAVAGGMAGVLMLARRGRSRRRQERLAYEQELRLMHEELSHLTRVAMLGELSGSLAHELNQPLAAVLSNAQAGLRFLWQGNPDMEEMQAILEDIAGDAKRAGGIIHGMRAMFKKDTRLELQPVDLNEVVRQVLDLLHGEFVARQASVIFTPASPLPPVLAGRVELTQVLINLLLNSFDAMKEMPAPRRAQITTAVETNRIVVTVRDFGPGIAPEVREKLFTPFVSTKSGGLGMGLAISRSIVERFGGRLSAENHPGGGAEFSILLPPAPPANAPLQPQASAVSEPAVCT